MKTIYLKNTYINFILPIFKSWNPTNIISIMSSVYKILLGGGESGFNCWGVRGPALVLFLFYVNVSRMCPQSRLSSQPFTLLAPWVYPPHRVVFHPGSTLGEFIPFPCRE